MKYLLRAALCIFTFSMISAWANDRDFLDHGISYASLSMFEPHSNGQWVVGVGGGADALFFSNRKNTLVNNVSGSAADTFTVDHTTKVIGNIHALVGYDWLFDSNVDDNRAFRLALEYDYFTQANVNGTRIPQGLTVFSSQYSYAIHRQSLLLIAKSDVAQWDRIMPYLQAGLGVSRNQFSDFSDPSTLSMVPFSNKTVYQLAAVVGLGVDLLMTTQLIASLGYQFGYWGDLESGSVNTVVGGAALPASIHLSHVLYSNQGVLTLNYRFA